MVEVGANEGKENGRINISSRELSERAYIRYYMYVVQKPDKRGTGGWELARATLDSRGKLVSLASKKVFGSRAGKLLVTSNQLCYIVQL